MATAREDTNPYDGGLGTGGKFRKRPFRRSQTTPYDRPPTAIRNTSHSNSNSNNRNIGWLSKLMDPAQRLITSSAHRLFASVFQKRLPPPPPPPPQQSPEPDANQNVRDEDYGVDTTLPTKNPLVIQGETNECDNPSNRSDRDGLTELEQILGQKTFTRSEIDRLTTLLRSRTVDTSAGNDEKRSEVIPSKSVVSYDRKEEIQNTPIRGNGIQSHVISTPLSSSSVLDEDIASPAELARAYMGCRPSKVSPSMLGLPSQVVREDSIVLSNRPFPPKSPMMSLVPRSSGNVVVPENGFITPRSRGRTAIYSMARTPYSRVHSTATVKGARPTTEIFGGPSSLSSQSAWEQNRLSGSKQGALKRRSSVLDNDIGSVGPIRRIRQKSNLLPSKNLSLPASGTPLSVHAIAIGSDAQPPSSSKQKPVVLGEVKSTENAYNSIPGTSYFSSFTPVPSKSSEIASKILEQIDKLVPSREKSPTKLSPSMLRGPALKSLENVDSSKFMENLQYNVKPSGSLDTLLPDAEESVSQKHDKVEVNGLTKSFAPRYKSAPVMNGVDATMKDNVPSVNATDSPVVNSVAVAPPQKKRAFRMSAHEDYLDLDDDDYSNGAAYVPLAGGREKLDTSMMGNKTIVSEAVKVEAPLLSEVNPLASSVLNRKADNGTSDGSMDAGKSRVTSTAASPSMTVHPAMVVTEPISTFGKAASPNKSINGALFSFGETSKEPNSASTTSNFGVNIDDEALQFTSASSSSAVSESLGLKFAVSSDPKPETQISFAAGAVASLPKAFDSDKAVINNALKSGSISYAVSTSPTGSIFSFGAATNSSSLNNGSLATSPSSFSSLSPPLASNNVISQSSLNNYTNSVAANSSNAAAALDTGTSVNTTNNSSLSSTALVPSFSTASPVFKFGSSVTPTSASTIPATCGIESTEAKTKDTSFGDLTSVPFGGTSSAITSTESKIFGGTSPAVATTGSSLFGGTSSAIGSTGSNIFGGTASTTTGTLSSIFSGTSSAIATTGSSIFSGTSAITSTGGNLFGGTSSSAGNSVFGFTAAPISTSNQSQGTNPFMAGNAQMSAAGTGIAASTQSIPIQFGSSASAPSFGLAGNTAFSSGTSPFGSSTAGSKLFSSGATFGPSSSSSGVNNSISSSSSTTSSVFGTSWQAPKSPVFSSTSNSSSSSTGFSYGVSSVSGAAASNSAPMVFGSTTGVSSLSIFPFNSPAAATSSQPVFGNPNPGFTFNSASTNSNDQMNMEDSMAEDTVQATTSTVPVFGQQPIAPPQSNLFGAAPSTGSSPFQFGGQQSIAAPQNILPFQASSSLEFNAGGGSFSLGSGGGDKSARKIVRVKHSKPRKK